MLSLGVNLEEPFWKKASNCKFKRDPAITSQRLILLRSCTSAHEDVTPALSALGSVGEDPAAQELSEKHLEVLLHITYLTAMEGSEVDQPVSICHGKTF